MAEVLVLGAGMAGICAALSLQARGHQVTVIDRSAPGRETSYGNAGVIQAEVVQPYAMPLGLGDLTRIALGRSFDVRWSWRDVLGQSRALLAYARHSRPAPHAHATRVYARLIRQATTAHAALIDAAGAGALIRRLGYLELHRDARAFDAGGAMSERYLRDYGVASTMLDRAALAQAEPALATGVAVGATLWSDCCSCTDPGALVAGYAALFQARGGQIVQGDAMTLVRDGAGWRAAGQGGAHAVIALGPWMPDLVQRFGLRLPMVLKRGYHRHFQIAQAPQRPIVDPANGLAISPMRAGLRVATGADLRRNPDANPPQMQNGEAAARQLFDLGEPVEPKPWSGRRPCMADMLPLVGAVPGQPGLWLHGGHGHQGFTLPPVTAEILADAMEGGGWPELAPARLT